MKTLDVIAKEWFDKANGNSYFSATVTVDYGTESEKEFLLPFQYGYGSSYEYEALRLLKEKGIVNDEISALWHLKEKGVILRLSKQENCLKRDLNKGSE